MKSFAFNIFLDFLELSYSFVVKSVSEEIFGVLKHVLNLSINQGVFPENMKIVCVTPIFKSSYDY